MGATVPQIKKPYRHQGNMSSLLFFRGGGVEFTCECVNDYLCKRSLFSFSGGYYYNADLYLMFFLPIFKSKSIQR